MFVHPDHNNQAVSLTFGKTLASDGWIITNTNVLHHDYGDSVIGLCWLLIEVHSNTKPGCTVLELQPPPRVPPRPLARFIWDPFNRPELALSYSKDNPSFNIQVVNNNGIPPLRPSAVITSQWDSFGHGVKLSYNLHCQHDNPATLVGSAVIDMDGLCPAFNPNINSNLFGSYFGVKFVHNGYTYVGAISPFEFVSCFCLNNKLTYQLSQHCNSFCMDARILAITSA